MILHNENPILNTYMNNLSLTISNFHRGNPQVPSYIDLLIEHENNNCTINNLKNSLNNINPSNLNYLNNLISDVNKNGMFCCQDRKTHQLKMEIKKLNKEIDKNKILIDNLKKDIEYFKSQCSSKNICAICNDNPREYANIQCGHLCACATCASKLENICPICKQLGSFKKIYVS